MMLETKRQVSMTLKSLNSKYETTNLKMAERFLPFFLTANLLTRASSALPPYLTPK